MVVMMIVLVALGTIAGLTVISVQSGSASANAQRFDAIALYAAESGAVAAMNWLKVNFDDDVYDVWGNLVAAGSKFSQYVNYKNVNPESPIGIPGNNALPGTTWNLLSADQQAWYQVKILNNRSDGGYAKPGGEDEDGVVIIQSTGHGPNGAMKQIEWEVFRMTAHDAAGKNPMVLIGWRDLY